MLISDPFMKQVSDFQSISYSYSYCKSYKNRESKVREQGRMFNSPRKICLHTENWLVENKKCSETIYLILFENISYVLYQYNHKLKV